MRRIFTWPAQLPESLDGLFAAVEAGAGASSMVQLTTLDDINVDRTDGGSDALLMVLDAALVSGESTVEAAIGGLEVIADSHNLNLVAVIGDGLLGTDTAGYSTAMGAAAAVTAVRSIAVKRGGSSRANAVCIPEALFGNTGSQRGPIPSAVECTDVAEAALFFLDDSNSYLNGQVLFVNGGRHLFSSLSA